MASTQDIEALAAKIGENVYIDVAKWHLYLNDAHLHTTVAEKVYPLLEDDSLSEDAVSGQIRWRQNSTNLKSVITYAVHDQPLRFTGRISTRYVISSKAKKGKEKRAIADF